MCALLLIFRFRDISIESLHQIGKAGFPHPPNPDGIGDGLFSLCHNPQRYLMEVAGFHLFLALNADRARINSFNGKAFVQL